MRPQDSLPRSPASKNAGGRVCVSVRVVPGAQRTQLQGWYGTDALKVRVAAPPEDGAANHELASWMKKNTGAQHVEILSGAGARNKLLALDFLHEPLSAQEIFTRLDGASRSKR